MIASDVHPDHQGKGIGTAIVSDIIADGQRKGKPVRSHVRKVDPARNLFERLGFSLIEETKTHFSMLTSIPKKELS